MASPGRTARAIPLATLFALGAAIHSAAPAQAADPPRTTLPGFSEIIVDQANQQVLVSAGQDGPGIAVLRLDGTFERIVDLPGASGMVIDGKDLYVTASASNRIAVLDRTSLSERRSISIGRWTHPNDLTLVDGRLWFQAVMPTMTECCRGATVRPDGGAVRYAPISAFASPGFVRGVPPDHAVYIEGGPPGGIDRFGIRDGRIERTLEQDGRSGVSGWGASDAVFVPGHGTILMATGRTRGNASDIADAATEVIAGTLKAIRTYQAAFQTSAVAASEDGSLLAAASDVSPDVPGAFPIVWVYRYGQSTPAWSSTIPGIDGRIIGLAFSGDQRELYVVAGRRDNTTVPRVDLFVLHPLGQNFGTPRHVSLFATVILLAVAAVLGLLVAGAAREKGYGPSWLWWLFGTMTFAGAAIVLLLLKRRGPPPETEPPIPPPPVSVISSSRPGPNTP